MRHAPLVLDRSYRFRGQIVRYAVSGTGPAVVFVHGTPFSSHVWHRVIPQVADSHTVYCFDLLGYGQSEKADNQDVSLGVQNLLLSEFVATFGLLVIILGCVRLSASAVPYAVGLYITAAYWFTSSTSFANPVVTLARSASDTFAGIRFADVPGFIIAQLFGGIAAIQLLKWLVPAVKAREPELLVPHPTVSDPVLAESKVHE